MKDVPACCFSCAGPESCCTQGAKELAGGWRVEEGLIHTLNLRNPFLVCAEMTESQFSVWMVSNALF